MPGRSEAPANEVKYSEIIDKVYEDFIAEAAKLLLLELVLDDRDGRHAGSIRRFQNGMKAAAVAREHIKNLVIAILIALFLLTTASAQDIGPGERLRQIDLEKQIQNERFERAREMSESAKLKFQQLLTEENELKAKLGPSKTETPTKTK